MKYEMKIGSMGFNELIYWKNNEQSLAHYAMSALTMFKNVNS